MKKQPTCINTNRLQPSHFLGQSRKFLSETLAIPFASSSIFTQQNKNKSSKSNKKKPIKTKESSYRTWHDGGGESDQPISNGPEEAVDFAGEGGVGGETSSEPPSQLVERAIQLGALSLELGGEGGSLGNGELRVEPVVEEGECGGRDVRGWRQCLEPLHRENRVSMVLRRRERLLSGAGFRCLCG